MFNTMQMKCILYCIFSLSVGVVHRGREVGQEGEGKRWRNYILMRILIILT